MRISYFLSYILIILLVSCSNEKENSKPKEILKSGRFLLRTQHLFSKGELNVSAPVWFDETLIKLNNIKTISRKFMNTVDLNEDIELVNEEHIYSFDTNGRIIQLEMKSYYEGVLYNDVTITYNGVKTIYNSKDLAITKENDYRNIGIDAEDVYSQYSTNLNSDGFSINENELKNRKEFFVHDRKYWSPIKIDSLFHPEVEDLIIWGTPEVPVKKYRVKNLVKERGKERFNYLNGNLIGKTRFVYPFKYVRTITYNDTLCSGFIDSTFSQGEYLNRKAYEFELNKLKLLSKIKEVGNKDVIVEDFEYEYYTK